MSLAVTQAWDWRDLPLILTAAEAAQVLRVQPRTITNMLCGGRLKGAKIGAKEWRIARAELMRFMGEDGNNGSRRPAETVNAALPVARSAEESPSQIAAAEDEDPDAPWEFEGLFELIGIAEGAPPDMSSNVDKYLVEAYAE
jgi:excisionase family DNA binding protein